jgi:hypothetical protein
MHTKIVSFFLAVCTIGLLAHFTNQVYQAENPPAFTPQARPTPFVATYTAPLEDGRTLTLELEVPLPSEMPEGPQVQLRSK